MRNARRSTSLAVTTLLMVAVASFAVVTFVPAATDPPSAGTPPAGHPVPGDGSLRYKSYLFHLPGKVKLTFYQDVNGDSLVDVIAVHGNEKADEPARNLVIFLQHADGFSAEPDVRYRVPDEVALIDLADVSVDSPGEELLLLDDRGVSWVPLTGTGSGARLVDARSIYAHADPLHLEKRDFARSRKGETLAILLIPVTEGYRLYYPADHYAEGQTLVMPHLHELNETDYTVHASDIYLADVNGDGAEDLAITYLDRLAVYFSGGAHFHDQPDIDLELGIITNDDRESLHGLANLVGFQLQDLNGDSLADAFVWKRVIAKKAVIHDKQQYQIFRNRGGRYERVPDQAFILRSLEGKPSLRDLNGDTRPDLTTGTMDFSIPNLVKVLVTGRLDFDLNFFLAKPDGFPDQPDETRTFKIKVSLSNLDEFFVPAVEVEGDYDGDGVRDFLLQTADQEIEVFRGRRSGEGLYEKKASSRLETAASEHDVVKDMNGDGKDDIAFDQFRDRKPFDPGWINVLLSQ